MRDFKPNPGGKGTTAEPTPTDTDADHDTDSSPKAPAPSRLRQAWDGTRTLAALAVRATRHTIRAVRRVPIIIKVCILGSLIQSLLNFAALWVLVIMPNPIKPYTNLVGAYAAKALPIAETALRGQQAYYAFATKYYAEYQTNAAQAQASLESFQERVGRAGTFMHQLFYS
jgi:hypothetical protein